MLETLHDRGFEFDLHSTLEEWARHHMVVLYHRGIRVDWLKAMIPTYAHILDRATTENVLGRSVRIASTEGLILLKLLAGRARDWADIDDFLPGYAKSLDDAWIMREWEAIADANDPRMIRFQEMLQRAREKTTDLPI